MQLSKSKYLYDLIISKLSNVATDALRNKGLWYVALKRIIASARLNGVCVITD